MSNSKFGFRDRRTPVELALAPGQPAGRVITKGTGFKPNLDASKTLGGVTRAATLASGTFSQLKSRLETKKSLQQLSTSLTSAVSAFDSESAQLLTGRTVMRDTDVFGIAPPSNGGFFSAADIIQSSFFKPGAEITSAVKNELRARKSQLTSISTRLGNLSGNFSLFGTSVVENYNRTPRPSDNELDGPSTPLLAQGGAAAQRELALKDKNRFVVKGSTTALPKPAFWTRTVATIKNPLKSYKTLPGFNTNLNMTFRDDKSRQVGWSEPASPFGAQWPYNHVQQTESGHIFELDDTPGAERVHLFHRSGSFVEMHPDGKVVVKSMSHQYIISMADQNVRVSGACNITVDGDASIYSRGNVNLQSDKDINVNAKKDFNVFAENVNLRAKKNAVLDGSDIDLRYVRLPGKPVFTTSGPAARIITGALRADFPDATAKMDAAQYFVNSRLALLKTSIAAKAVSPLNFATVTRDMLQVVNILQNGLFPSTSLPPVFKLPTLAKTPRETPLGNPLVYSVKSSAAAAYRARMFDTPDEILDAELYQAHTETRKALGDVSSSAGPTLPGNRQTPSTNVAAPESLPPVNYLDRDTFRGQYAASAGYALAGTSFTVGMLVDSLARPEVANYTSAILPDVAETKFTPPPGGITLDDGSGGTGGYDGPIGKPADIPDDVLRRVEVYVSVYPIPQGSPGGWFEEVLRVWIKRLAEQIRYDFPRLNPALGGEFGMKRASETRPISKDALAWKVGGRLFGWDLLVGASSGQPRLSSPPAAHDLIAEGNQIFVPVSPVNHVGDL